MNLFKMRAGSVATCVPALLLIACLEACSGGAPDEPIADVVQSLEHVAAVEEEALLQTAKDAADEDLALLAQLKGWTIDEATRHRAASDAVGTIANEILRTRPEIFVGSIVSDEPDEAPTLLIKGRADQGVRNLLSGSPVSIRVEDQQPYSFAELEARKLAVHRELERRGYRYVVTSAGIQHRGLIRSVVTKEPALEDDPDRIMIGMPDHLKDFAVVGVSESPVARDELAFGGMSVFSATNLCTSGWTLGYHAFWTDLVMGVTTAGHCPSMTTIDDPPGPNHALTFEAEHRGQWGDVEYSSVAAVTAEPRFYATGTSIRDVLASEPIGSISLGETICLYSRIQGARRCAAVNDVSLACTLSGVFNDRLVQMDTDVSVGGDSGSGWSFNNTAYGGHKGDCGSLSSFSAADYFDEAVGHPVLLQ